jgi:predicted exporter
VTSNERKTLGVAGFLFVAVTIFVALRFEVSTDITTFLPDPGDQEMARLSREIIESELSRTMVLTLHHEDVEVAVEAAREFEGALRGDERLMEEVAFLEGGPPVGIEEAIWELYHPRRFSFAARSASEVAPRLTDEALAESAADLLRQLERPMSPLLTRVAPGDPLLFLIELFQTLEGSRGEGLRMINGRFVGRHGEHAVLFLGTVAPAFDSEIQGPLLEAISGHFSDTNARYAGELTLAQSGVNRFAVQAEASIKADIQRVSTLSVVGLGLLILLLFRSPRLLLLASAPVGTGVIAGSAATLLVFGRIHGVTLAFGAALIGVAIDYVAHFYCHQAVCPTEGGPRATLRSIWGAIATGAATTIAGFIALAGSSFQGLREVSLFAVVGIGAALAITRFVLPILIPAEPKAVPLRDAFVDLLGKLLSALRRNRKLLWIFPAAAVAVCAVGLPRMHWNAEFADLGALDAELLAEDEAVRDRVALFEQMKFVVALGESVEEALQANDRVRVVLDRAVEASQIDGYRSLATLLPSSVTQRGVDAAFRGSPELWPRIQSAFEAVGFRPGALLPFQETLQQPTPEPLTYDALAASPLAPLIRPFRIQLGDRVAIVSYLHQVNDADALNAALEDIEGAHFLDQATMMGSANRAYQQSTFRLVCLGLVAVLILLALRYRDPRRTLAAYLPAVLGAACTIAVLALLQIPLDLVALTALLMVVSMGVDYGVFLVDAEAAGELELRAALLSIAVACSSTILGFGLLALSSYPVLRIIGLTAGIGVLTCLLLAPTTLVLLRGEDS